jgi:hypothetical protein
MKSRASDFRTRRPRHRPACLPSEQETRVRCKAPVKHNTQTTNLPTRACLGQFRTPASATLPSPGNCWGERL